MPITLVTGPANAGKAEVVMDAVRRHLAHGQEPLLVVPTGADADHYRRELAGDGTALGVTVERFGGLLATVARQAGVSEPVVGSAARQQLLAAVLSRAGARARESKVDDLPTRDGRLHADTGDGRLHADAGDGDPGPGVVRALGELFAELQVRRISGARFSRAVALWTAVDGARRERLPLGRLYESYLQALDRLGRVDPESQAVRALDELRRRPALWGRRPVLVYGFDDLTALQVDVIETLGRVVDAEVTVSLSYEPGRAAFGGRAATYQTLLPMAAEQLALAARSDHYAADARAALSHLERSLFEPTAVVADAGGAVRLLEGADERSELELVADEIGRLLQSGMPAEEIAVVMRSPAAAADLVEEVFGAVGIPFGLQRRRPLAAAATGRALIGLLRCASGEGEAEDLLAWLRAPGLLDNSQLVDRLEADVRRRGAATAAQARQLWEERRWPLDAIDEVAQAAERGPVALIERARRELERLFAAPRTRQARLLAHHELDEAGAFTAAARALGELRELAALSPGHAPGHPGELARALARVELISGEGPRPGAVAILDPLRLRARRVRALFACRLQEGTFPALARSQALLGEHERRRLAEVADLRLGEAEDVLAAERYLFYATASRPQELLVLSWHAMADDGGVANRSLFVDDCCDLFANGLQRAGEADHLERGAACAAPASSAGRRAPAIAPLGDRQLLGELRAHVWSPSSLQLWMGCPVRWLVERLLRAHDLDPDPEPLARGGLAHAVLSDTFEGLRSRTGSARLTAERLELARELLGEALARRAEQHDLSVSPERALLVRRRLRAELERYLEHVATEESPRGMQPEHLELEFGFDDGPPALDLGDGVMLRGRIDRVDVDEQGRAVVYDYKGRDVNPAAKWIARNDVQIALYMTAVQRLLGLRVAGGFYQPLAGRDLRARGALDVDSGVEMEAVGGDRLGAQELEALVAQAAGAAREAAEQAGRGELSPRPRTCSYGGGCAYPAICRCEPW